MLWQICAVVCTVVVLLVAWYAIQLMRAARSTLQRTDQALIELQQQVAQTTTESSRLIRLTSTLLENVERKLHTADDFLDAIEQTGETVSRITHSVHELSQTITDTVLEAKRSVHNGQSTVNDLAQLTTTTMQLWDRWQSYRQSRAGQTVKHSSEE